MNTQADVQIGSLLTDSDGEEKYLVLGIELDGEFSVFGPKYILDDGSVEYGQFWIRFYNGYNIIIE